MFFISLPKSSENRQCANAPLHIIVAITSITVFHFNSNVTFALISSEAAPIKALKFVTNSRHIAMQPLSTQCLQSAHSFPAAVQKKPGKNNASHPVLSYFD